MVSPAGAFYASPRMPNDPTPEEILNDPSGHTVEQVTDALKDADASRVAQVKALEEAGKGRVAIRDFTLASEEEPDAGVSSSESYVAEQWAERSSWFGVSRHAIVGALSDVEPSKVLSQPQVQRRLERFLGRKVES